VGQPLPGVKVRIVDPGTEKELPSGQPGELRVKVRVAVVLLLSAVDLRGMCIGVCYRVPMFSRNIMVAQTPLRRLSTMKIGLRRVIWLSLTRKSKGIPHFLMVINLDHSGMIHDKTFTTVLIFFGW